MSAAYWLYWAVLTLVNAALLVPNLRLSRRSYRLLAEARRVVIDRKDASHRNAMAVAWDEGYYRGVRDNELDMEPADNPYRAES